MPLAGAFVGACVAPVVAVAAAVGAAVLVGAGVSVAGIGVATVVAVDPDILPVGCAAVALQPAMMILPIMSIANRDRFIVTPHKLARSYSARRFFTVKYCIKWM